MVSLLIGVNNQYRNRSTDEYRVQFVELLEQAIIFANHLEQNVMVISIPDWGVTPFAKDDKRSASEIAHQIDIFNEINMEETNNRQCHYVDITPISKEASVNRSLTADDGLHPSGNMYSLWVDRIYPVATNILKN